MTSRKLRLLKGRRGPGWPLLIVPLAGILALGAAFLTLANPLTGSDDDEPSRYIEAIVGAPTRVNPLFAHLNDVDRDVASLVFSGLTRLGPDGEILPDLAQSWAVSHDGRTVTFYLRPDITWHEGPAASPFTSADVLFTYGLLADPNLQGDPDQLDLWRQVGCEAQDELTVRCELPQPFAPFLSFTTVGILPQHILGEVDATSLFDQPFNQAPVGTGPFQLFEMDQTRALLTANATYHLGRPQLDEIELRFYTDTSTAAAALADGDVHALFLDPSDPSTDQTDFDTLAASADIQAYAANRTAHTVLYLNNAKSPFDNPLVRNAIARAIDVDAIVGRLPHGSSVPAYSPIVPGTWAFNPDIEPYPYDTIAAGALLDEAGWLLPEDGAVRERDGVKLRISLVTDRESLAQEIASQMAVVGIAATVVIQDTADLVRDSLIPRRYQAAIFGWDQGPDPDPYPAWHSSQTGRDGRNLAAYVSARADKLLEVARLTSDIERRRELYYAFQEIFHTDVPSLPLYYTADTYFVSDQVKDLKLGTLFYSSSRFNNIHEWSLDKAGDSGGR